MIRRMFAGAAVALACAAPGGAADLVAVAPGAVAAGEPMPLEWVRHVRPRIGRATAVPAGGVAVRTIEWRRPVEVRVRTVSGAVLGAAGERAVRDRALVCDRGEVRDPATRTETNGTFVVTYDCAWLQGLEGR